MNKLILALAILVLLTQTVYAQQVGVYIQQAGKDPTTHCVDVDAKDDAYLVLKNIDTLSFWNIEDTHVLCISGKDKNFICDKNAPAALRVVMQQNNNWQTNGIPSIDAGNECYNPTSFDIMANFQYYSYISHQFMNIHYCAKDGDVLGVFTENIPTGQPTAPDAEYTPTFEEICTPLQLNSVKAYADGQKIDSLNADGDTIKHLHPGAELEIQFTLENIIPKNFKDDITDIAITGVIENIDQGNDLSFDEDLFDLAGRKDKNVKLTFNIPYLVEEDTYTLTITVEGEDEDGYVYEQEIEYDVEIEKEDHGVALVIPASINQNLCAGETNTVIVGLINTGNNDERVTLSISNVDLGVSFTQQVQVPKITSTKQHMVEEPLAITLSPQTKDTQTNLLITASYSGKSAQPLYVPITISSCKNQVAPPMTADVIATPQTAPPSIPSNTGSTTKKKENTAYSPLLFTIIGLVIVLLIMTIVVFARKK